MTQFRSLPLLACLLLGACASQAPKSAPPSGGTAIAPAADAPVRDDAVMTAQAAAAGVSAPDAMPASAAAPADQQAAAGTDTATAGAPTDAESDFDALYGSTTPQAGANGAPAQPGAAPAYDPWERYNRGMHRFNMAVDRGVARPLATAYTKVVPSPARLGVTNFFDNLGTPLTMVNQL
ncbi:MlaA family lipoprotein, partial [Xanthomonas oryzae]